MYTSILLVALTGMAPSEGSKAPAWSQDYTAAGQLAAQDKKPLLVVFAPGQGAYDKLGRDGGLSADARALLADQYVCVHVDTTTSKGQQLAQAFDIFDGLGIAISDRTGEKMAFYHEGDLANADLVRYLQRYSDPNRVVEFTESNPGRRHKGAAVSSCSSGSCGTCGSCGGGSCGGGRRHHRGCRR
jgi:hypothetical protein